MANIRAVSQAVPVAFSPQHPAEESLLTAEEVAEKLKVPVSWIRQRTRRRAVNRIPGYKLGKYWRFREIEVLAWLEKQKVGGHST